MYWIFTALILKSKEIVYSYLSFISQTYPAQYFIKNHQYASGEGFLTPPCCSLAIETTVFFFFSYCTLLKSDLSAVQKHAT